MLLTKIPFTYLLFFTASVFAQPTYVFQHVTVEDGLIANPKVNMYQDAQGFYWFCDFSGIQRFDGNNFITQKFNYKIKNISEGGAGIATEDKEKNIWITNKDGISIYYKKQRTLKRLYLSDTVNSNTGNTNVIIKDRENEIWIVTTKNIFHYNYKIHKPVLFCTIIKDEHKGIIMSLYDSNNNGFWLMISDTSKQLAYFNCKTKQLSYIINNVDQLLGHENPISFFKKDLSGNVWMANYLGDFCKYNISSGITTHYNILHENDKLTSATPNATILDCLDDGNGTIWFGGDAYIGLLKYNTNTGEFVRIEHENGSEYGLHYNEEIYSFFKDREGNIWINTDQGMNIFNPGMQQFKYINLKSGYPATKFGADITSIFESSTNTIWISTWGSGLFKYDSNFVFQKNYMHDKNNDASLGEPLNRTWTINEDAKGKIWVGSQYGMLSVLDTLTGKFINKNITAFEHKTIMQIARSKNYTLWFGLLNGVLAKWDVDSHKMVPFKNLRAACPVDGLFIDENNKVWVAGERGLNMFDEDKKAITEIALPSEHVFSPLPLNDSIIIGGTSGNGLFLFNKITKKTHFFTIADGLSSNIVYGAVAGKGNTAWVITSNDIEHLNLLTGKISTYNINDGIIDHVFARAFTKLKNGYILVATNSGIIYFNPDSIKTRSKPEDVVITNFSAGQQNLSVDSLLQYKNIILPYQQNSITIDYASVSFTGIKTDQYFYQLQGIDKEWIFAGLGRSVTYANLDAGKYTFNVKCQNFDGISTKHITSIIIIIHPPWWQTWWAYLLCFIIAASIIFAVFGYRKRSINALSQIRQKIANDLHDDIGSTLNSISVYSEIANQQIISNTENAKKLLEKMGDTSRNMIDTMNDIVWAINPKNDEFENIVQRMQYFAGELLSGKNMLLQFEADEKVKTIKLPMEKRKNFYLIFKEAINNAFKYSNGKTIKVIIALEVNTLLMIITDDGIGFDTLQKSAVGNGLKSMQMRAKEIGGILKITSWQKKGTIVELRLPVN